MRRERVIIRAVDVDDAGESERCQREQDQADDDGPQTATLFDPDDVHNDKVPTHTRGHR